VISIISTIIVSALFGTFSPALFSGVNLFPSQNLFSQVSSSLQKKSLQNVNPMSSLDNVTVPLNSIWQAVDQGLNNSGLGGIKDYLRNNQKDASNLPLEGRLNVQKTFDTSTAMDVIGAVKYGVILVAQISVAVLEIALRVLKAILNIIT
jgi:hypothetical protein